MDTFELVREKSKRAKKKMFDKESIKIAKPEIIANTGPFMTPGHKIRPRIPSIRFIHLFFILNLRK